MTVNVHYLCQCIFASEYGHLLTPYHSQANCI